MAIVRLLTEACCDTVSTVTEEEGRTAIDGQPVSVHWLE